MMKFLSGITRNLNQLLILKEQHEFRLLILEEEKTKNQGSLLFWEKLTKEKCILLLWLFQEVNTLAKNGIRLKLSKKRIKLHLKCWKRVVNLVMSWFYLIDLEILIVSYLGSMCCLFGLRNKSIIKDFLSLVMELLVTIIIPQDYWPKKNLKKEKNPFLFQKII